MHVHRLIPGQCSGDPGIFAYPPGSARLGTTDLISVSYYIAALDGLEGQSVRTLVSGGPLERSVITCTTTRNFRLLGSDSLMQ